MDSVYGPSRESEDLATAIVNSLYESILGRQADVGGLHTYRDRLRALGVERGVSDIVKNMISSQEFRQSFQYSLSSIGPNGGRTVNGKKSIILCH